MISNVRTCWSKSKKKDHKTRIFSFYFRLIFVICVGQLSHTMSSSHNLVQCLPCYTRCTTRSMYHIIFFYVIFSFGVGLLFRSPYRCTIHNAMPDELKLEVEIPVQLRYNIFSRFFSSISFHLRSVYMVFFYCCYFDWIFDLKIYIYFVVFFLMLMRLMIFHGL